MDQIDQTETDKTMKFVYELPEDILYNLLININIEACDLLYNIIQINKYYYTQAIDIYYNKLQEYFDILKIESPSHVINKLDNIFNVRKLVSLPTLHFKDIYIGNTGYIDGIRAIDVSHCIMKGTDNNGRKFITFKLKYRAKNDNIDYLNLRKDDVKESVSTLFQRYMYLSDQWVFGTNSNIHLYEYNRPDEQDLENYKKIIDGETVETNDFYVSLSII